MQRAEQIEEDTKNLRSGQLDFFKQNAIARLANGDPELTKSIEAAYQEFAGDAQDQSSVEARVFKAARLVTGEKAMPNQVTASFAQVGAAPTGDQAKASSFADTPEGKDLAARLNLKLEPPKQQ